ncbi:MAG: ribosomal protection-like ABC-F family protein [Intestinibacillus sp.]
MADLSIQHLTKYYGDRLILDDISFDIQPGEKVALLGANGAGKTTLFHVLTGRLPYDGGTVTVGAGRSVGVIDQMPRFDPGTTVEDVLRAAFRETDEIIAQMTHLENEMAKNASDAGLLKQYGVLAQKLEALGGWSRDYEIDKVANGLEIPQAQRAQAFSLLSGGEQTRVNLARIILEKTDVLLLDEPTNHLDMNAVAWLGEYLDGYAGTVFIISHDRYFLDQCCTRIVELRDQKCDFYAGSYSYYAEERKRRIEQQLALHQTQEAERQRLTETARKMHQHGTEHLAKRAASIEKRIARMKVTDRPRPEKRMSMSFGDPDYETEDVLKVRDITKSFEGRTVLQNVSFNVRNGERIAILGDNGTGKTTLLRILTGELPPDAGSVKKGVGLRPAYLPQKVHFTNENRNLIETLIYDKNLTMQTARNRLGAFLFSGEDQQKLVRTLSGGEKSRLRLCELMYDPLNMLILDEPTNHLDILSREWLEEAVESFTGTLLFVSHDRYFVERFATRILYLENGGYTDFQGTYEAFLAYRAGQPAPASTPQAAKPAARPGQPTLDDVPKPPERKKGGTKSLQKLLGSIEREISQLETQAEELTQQMVCAASDSHRLLALMTEKEACDEALAAKMDEWEAVSLELDGTG